VTAAAAAAARAFGEKKRRWFLWRIYHPFWNGRIGGEDKKIPLTRSPCGSRELILRVCAIIRFETERTPMAGFRVCLCAPACGCACVRSARAHSALRRTLRRGRSICDEFGRRRDRRTSLSSSVALVISKHGDRTVINI